MPLSPDIRVFSLTLAFYFYNTKCNCIHRCFSTRAAFGVGLKLSQYENEQQLRQVYPSTSLQHFNTYEPIDRDIVDRIDPTMPVNTISADQVVYRNGRPVIAPSASHGSQHPRRHQRNRPNQQQGSNPAIQGRRQQPSRYPPVRGFGDKGPDGYACRAHQLKPLLSLVQPGVPVAIDCEGVILDDEVGENKCGAGRVSATTITDDIILDTFACYSRDVSARPPPAYLGLGVYRNDIKKKNGAQPIAEVYAAVQAIVDKAGIVIMHSAQSDQNMLRGVDFSNVKIYDTQQFSEYMVHALRDIPSLSSQQSGTGRNDPRWHGWPLECRGCEGNDEVVPAATRSHRARTRPSPCV